MKYEYLSNIPLSEAIEKLSRSLCEEGFSFQTEQIPTTKALGGGDKEYVGAIANDQVAVFVTETGTDYRTSEISVSGISGTQKLDYYVGGLAAGKWQVKVGANTVGEFTVKDGEHFLTFNARAGRLTLTPVSE